MDTGFLTAVLSSVMNNMSAMVIGALSIDALGTSFIVKDAVTCFQIAAMHVLNDDLATGRLLQTLRHQ